MEKEIGLDEALCGTSFVLKHLSGEDTTIFRGAGECINSGQVLCCKGLGMPVRGRIYEHGNLFITFKVIFPKVITEDIRQMIMHTIGSAESRSRIASCSSLKHDGVKQCQLIYVNPDQRTKNGNDS